MENRAAARLPAEDDLPRTLSVIDAAALAVGIVIGTGIFAVPGYVAAGLGAPGPILAAWALGGAIVLAGVLTYAELAGLFPRQGGSFLYVYHAFGPFAAFLKGWASFLVGYPAAAAAVATVLGIYLAVAMGWPDSAVRPVALAAAAVVWGLSRRGTRFSASLQTALTFVKVGALGALVLLALAAGTAEWGRLFAGGGAPWPQAGAFGLALVGVLWTYDGWQNLTVVSGEVGDAGPGLKRALFLAFAIVFLVYMALNVCYLVLLPLDVLKGNASAASAAAEGVLGPAGGRLIAAFIAVSSFGALFGIAIAGPRYLFAMARRGLFFGAAGRVDPGTAAPRWGASAISLATIAYVLTGTFEDIMRFYIVIALAYNALSVLAVYVLRRKMPDAPRPFRVPGYPVVPALFVGAAVWVMGTEIAADPARAAAAAAVLAASVPAYFFWRRGRRVGAVS